MGMTSASNMILLTLNWNKKGEKQGWRMMLMSGKVGVGVTRDQGRERSGWKRRKNERNAYRESSNQKKKQKQTKVKAKKMQKKMKWKTNYG